MFLSIFVWYHRTKKHRATVHLTTSTPLVISFIAALLRNILSNKQKKKEITETKKKTSFSKMAKIYFVKLLHLVLKKICLKQQQQIKTKKKKPDQQWSSWKIYFFLLMTIGNQFSWVPFFFSPEIVTFFFFFWILVTTVDFDSKKSFEQKNE